MSRSPEIFTNIPDELQGYEEVDEELVQLPSDDDIFPQTVDEDEFEQLFGDEDLGGHLDEEPDQDDLDEEAIQDDTDNDLYQDDIDDQLLQDDIDARSLHVNGDNPLLQDDTEDQLLQEDIDDRLLQANVDHQLLQDNMDSPPRGGVRDDVPFRDIFEGIDRPDMNASGNSRASSVDTGYVFRPRPPGEPLHAKPSPQGAGESRKRRKTSSPPAPTDPRSYRRPHVDDAPDDEFSPENRKRRKSSSPPALPGPGANRPPRANNASDATGGPHVRPGSRPAGTSRYPDSRTTATGGHQPSLGGSRTRGISLPTARPFDTYERELPADRRSRRGERANRSHRPSASGSRGGPRVRVQSPTQQDVAPARPQPPRPSFIYRPDAVTFVSNALCNGPGIIANDIRNDARDWRDFFTSFKKTPSEEPVSRKRRRDDDPEDPEDTETQVVAMGPRKRARSNFCSCFCRLLFCCYCCCKKKDQDLSSLRPNEMRITNVAHTQDLTDAVLEFARKQALSGDLFCPEMGYHDSQLSITLPPSKKMPHLSLRTILHIRREWAKIAVMNHQITNGILAPPQQAALDMPMFTIYEHGNKEPFEVACYSSSAVDWKVHVGEDYKSVLVDMSHSDYSAPAPWSFKYEVPPLHTEDEHMLPQNFAREIVFVCLNDTAGPPVPCYWFLPAVEEDIEPFIAAHGYVVRGRQRLAQMSRNQLYMSISPEKSDGEMMFEIERFIAFPRIAAIFEDLMEGRWVGERSGSRFTFSALPWSTHRSNIDDTAITFTMDDVEAAADATAAQESSSLGTPDAQGTPILRTSPPGPPLTSPLGPNAHKSAKPGKTGSGEKGKPSGSSSKEPTLSNQEDESESEEEPSGLIPDFSDEEPVLSDEAPGPDGTPPEASSSQKSTPSAGRKLKTGRVSSSGTKFKTGKTPPSGGQSAGTLSRPESSVSPSLGQEQKIKQSKDRNDSRDRFLRTVEWTPERKLKFWKNNQVQDQSESQIKGKDYSFDLDTLLEHSRKCAEEFEALRQAIIAEAQRINDQLRMPWTNNSKHELHWQRSKFQLARRGGGNKKSRDTRDFKDDYWRIIDAFVDGQLVRIDQQIREEREREEQAKRNREEQIRLNDEERARRESIERHLEQKRQAHEKSKRRLEEQEAEDHASARKYFDDLRENVSGNCVTVDEQILAWEQHRDATARDPMLTPAVRTEVISLINQELENLKKASGAGEEGDGDDSNDDSDHSNDNDGDPGKPAGPNANGKSGPSGGKKGGAGSDGASSKSSSQPSSRHSSGGAGRPAKPTPKPSGEKDASGKKKNPSAANTKKPSASKKTDKGKKSDKEDTYNQSAYAINDSGRSQPTGGPGMALRSFRIFLRGLEGLTEDERLDRLTQHKAALGKKKPRDLKRKNALALEITFADTEIGKINQRKADEAQGEGSGENEDEDQSADEDEGRGKGPSSSDDGGNGPDDGNGPGGAAGGTGGPAPGSGSGGDAGDDEPRTSPSRRTSRSNSRKGSSPTSSSANRQGDADMRTAAEVEALVEASLRGAPTPEASLIDQYRYLRQALLTEREMERQPRIVSDLVQAQYWSFLEDLQQEMDGDRTLLSSNARRVRDEEAMSTKRERTGEQSDDDKRLLQDEDFRYHLGGNAQMLRVSRRQRGGRDHILDEFQDFAPEKVKNLRQRDGLRTSPGGANHSIAFKMTLITTGRDASPIRATDVDYYKDELPDDDADVQSDNWSVGVASAPDRLELLTWGDGHLPSKLTQSERVQTPDSSKCRTPKSSAKRKQSEMVGHDPTSPKRKRNSPGGKGAGQNDNLIDSLNPNVPDFLERAMDWAQGRLGDPKSRAQNWKRTIPHANQHPEIRFAWTLPGGFEKQLPDNRPMQMAEFDPAVREFFGTREAEYGPSLGLNRDVQSSRGFDRLDAPDTTARPRVPFPSIEDVPDEDDRGKSLEVPSSSSSSGADEQGGGRTFQVPSSSSSSDDGEEVHEEGFRPQPFFANHVQLEDQENIPLAPVVRSQEDQPQEQAQSDDGPPQIEAPEQQTLHLMSKKDVAAFQQQAPLRPGMFRAEFIDYSRPRPPGPPWVNFIGAYSQYIDRIRRQQRQYHEMMNPNQTRAQRLHRRGRRLSRERKRYLRLALLNTAHQFIGNLFQAQGQRAGGSPANISTNAPASNVNGHRQHQGTADEVELESIYDDAMDIDGPSYEEQLGEPQVDGENQHDDSEEQEGDQTFFSVEQSLLLPRSLELALEAEDEDEEDRSYWTANTSLPSANNSNQNGSGLAGLAAALANTGFPSFLFLQGARQALDSIRTTVRDALLRAHDPDDNDATAPTNIDTTRLSSVTQASSADVDTTALGTTSLSTSNIEQDEQSDHSEQIARILEDSLEAVGLLPQAEQGSRQTSFERLQNTTSLDQHEHALIEFLVSSLTVLANLPWEGWSSPLFNGRATGARTSGAHPLRGTHIQARDAKEGDVARQSKTNGGNAPDGPPSSISSSSGSSQHGPDPQIPYRRPIGSGRRAGKGEYDDEPSSDDEAAQGNGQDGRGTDHNGHGEVNGDGGLLEDHVRYPDLSSQLERNQLGGSASPVSREDASRLSAHIQVSPLRRVIPAFPPARTRVMRQTTANEPSASLLSSPPQGFSLSGYEYYVPRRYRSGNYQGRGTPKKHRSSSEGQIDYQPGNEENGSDHVDDEEGKIEPPVRGEPPSSSRKSQKRKGDDADKVPNDGPPARRIRARTARAELKPAPPPVPEAPQSDATNASAIRPPAHSTRSRVAREQRETAPTPELEGQNGAMPPPSRRPRGRSKGREEQG